MSSLPSADGFRDSTLCLGSVCIVEERRKRTQQPPALLSEEQQVLEHAGRDGWGEEAAPCAASTNAVHVL